MHHRAYSVIVFLSAAIFATPSAQAITAGFDTGFPASITVPAGSNQVAFSNLPVTNTTGASVSYSNSSTPTNVTGFSFNPNPGFVLPVVGDGAGSNNLILYVTPGTMTNTVTNTLIISVTNAPGANGTSTSLDVIVTPASPPPPYLEVRFYNTSTNPSNQVFILPTAASGGFWWTNAGNSNNWTNHIIDTTNLTVSLADIGVTGTNLQGKPYYSIYTTNFSSAAWFLSYGGGNLPAMTNTNGSWNGSTSQPGGGGLPAPSKPNGPWGFSQWSAFEIVLDGSAADVSDVSYINQFAIPLQIRVFTNSTTDSTTFFQHGGWTNYTQSAFNVMASNMVATFSNAVWYNTDGTKAVLIPGPSSASAGTLATTAITNNSQNFWPTFGPYFDVVRSNTVRTNKILDRIGIDVPNGSNTFSYFCFYDFDLQVTSSNSLKLTGSVRTTNQPGTPTTNTNTTNLTIEIGPDAGPVDNWSSWFVYGAPSPANFVTNGTVAVYSPNATNPSLPGQPVLKLGGDWQGISAFVGLTSTSPVTTFYTNKFSTAVIGRIMGDLAAGFALGFINSDVTNPSYVTNGTNAAYGDSPSGAWWGGGIFTNSSTNRLAFQDVQPNLAPGGQTYYSQYGNLIRAGGTALAYVHPIYDRMQVYGGGATAAGTPQDQLQPACATNFTPPIWVLELEMFNGLLSAPQPPLPPSSGARPVFLSPSNTPSTGISGLEGDNYPNFAQLTASNMNAPASWTVTGLPAGMTFSNVTNGGVVYCDIVGTPALGSGAAGQDGGRVYALTMVMSNSYGVVATNISSPANTNPASCYLQINTSNGTDPAPGLVAATPATLAALATSQGSPSTAGGYLVSGYNLSNSTISVTPPSGFEVSTNSASGFTASLTLTATNGTGANSSSLRLAATPVYVRLVGAPSGSFSGNVSNASTSVSGALVAVSGTVSGLSSVLTYSNWLASYPSLTGTNTNQAADPDSDSFNNATEYAFDGNPTVGSPAMLAANGAGTNGVFRFAGLQGASTNYTVQGTTNLATGPWTNSSVTVSNAADQSGLLLSNSYERREFTVPTSGSNAFFRVIFTNP